METVADIAFLPFDCHEHASGVLEVAVTDQLALYLEPDPATLQRGAPMNTITITGISDRAPMAKTP